MKPIVLFLDFDDVICLNAPYGAYDVMLALREVEKSEKKLEDFADMWEKLFDAKAKAHLKAIHEEFEPQYVLSSSWIKRMDRDALVESFNQTGLGFIADNLHSTWRTTDAQEGGVRADEINGWLSRHPQCKDRWIVLDDTHSGTGLLDWNQSGASSFITLCQVNVGLSPVEYEHLRASFVARAAFETNSNEGGAAAQDVEADHMEQELGRPREVESC
jgi:hypothetical protein